MTMRMTLGVAIAVAGCAVACEGRKLQDDLIARRPPSTPAGAGNLGHQDCIRGGSGSGSAAGTGVGSGGGTGVGSGAGSGGGTGNIMLRPCEETVDGGVADGGVDAGIPDAGPPCNEHSFEYVNATANSVWVTGTFSNWAETPETGALEMTAAGDTWSVTAVLEPPGTHQYKLIINGDTWIPDPANPDLIDDTFGGQNSVLVLCDGACGDLESFDWRDTVMYFVMTDRFFDGDATNNAPIPGASTYGNSSTGPSGQYEGGDLAGLEEKLPYLADLGVTSLWITAPYDNRDTLGIGADGNQYTGYHGYWPKPLDTSYADPDNPSPRPLIESKIGTEAELASVVAAAHGTTSANGDGIKVLFDYVMNHVDLEAPLYQSHPDWFATDNGTIKLCGSSCGGGSCWDDPYWGTRCAFTDYLPPFDFDNTTARAWSVRDAVWWAKTFDLDGFRLDAIKHVPQSWLTDLRSELNTAFPEPRGGRFYLVGETFDYDNRDLLRSFVEPSTKLDGQFDFPFKARVCEAVFNGSGMQAFSAWMDDNDRFYGPDALMTSWIGNHDIPRPIHFASGELPNCREGSWVGNAWTTDFNQPVDAAPYERLGLVFAIMMTNPSIPLIYYGDEVGLAGGGDPDNRRSMPWGSVNPSQEALRTTVRALARIRAENKVLSRGRRQTVSAAQDTWVYRMTGCGDGAAPVLIALNRADTSRTVTMPQGDYVDLISSAAVPGGSLTLPARSFRILR